MARREEQIELNRGGSCADWPRRGSVAVIAFQHCQRAKLTGKIADVALRRGAKSGDTLSVVADHDQPAILSYQERLLGRSLIIFQTWLSLRPLMAQKSYAGNWVTRLIRRRGELAIL
jgi:hypothetical protein